MKRIPSRDELYSEVRNFGPLGMHLSTALRPHLRGLRYRAHRDGLTMHQRTHHDNGNRVHQIHVTITPNQKDSD